MDESELISLAKQGDLDAYNQIVLKHQDIAYSYAFSILQNRQAAEDCTQDAFLQAYLHLRDYRGVSFRAWILRIVRNACYDELRRTKRQRVFSMVYKNQDGEDVDQLDLLVDPGISVEEKVEQVELHSALYQHLNALPDKYRSILYIVDILDFDYAEASAALNIPVGTVKSRLARGRQFLSSSFLGKQELIPVSA